MILLMNRRNMAREKNDQVRHLNYFMHIQGQNWLMGVLEEKAKNTLGR